MHTYDNSPKHIHTHELFMKHTEPILVNENLDRFTHISTIKIKQIHRQAKHTHIHTHTHAHTRKRKHTDSIHIQMYLNLKLQNDTCYIEFEFLLCHYFLERTMV